MPFRYIRKITIVEPGGPAPQNLEDEIRWVCRCLDLDPKRDKIAFETFLYILDASRSNKGVRTIDLTRKLDVTQAAVVYHMNSFIRAGVIVKRGREYFLRGGNLSRTMGALEQDVVRRLELMRNLAERIDSELL